MKVIVNFDGKCYRSMIYISYMYSMHFSIRKIIPNWVTLSENRSMASLTTMVSVDGTPKKVRKT